MVLVLLNIVLSRIFVKRDFNTILPDYVMFTFSGRLLYAQPHEGTVLPEVVPLGKERDSSWTFPGIRRFRPHRRDENLPI